MLSFFSLAVIGLSVIVIAFVVPSETSAHISVHETLEVVSVDSTDEPTPHCHGGIECVVTLYPAIVEGLAPLPVLSVDHLAARIIDPVGAGLRHDPPIPIFT